MSTSSRFQSLEDPDHVNRKARGQEIQETRETTGNDSCGITYAFLVIPLLAVQRKLSWMDTKMYLIGCLL